MSQLPNLDISHQLRLDTRKETLERPADIEDSGTHNFSQYEHELSNSASNFQGKPIMVEASRVMKAQLKPLKINATVLTNKSTIPIQTKEKGTGNPYGMDSFDK